MFSTDDTQEVCRAYPNVRIFERRDYIFGNVNFGFDQARTDWVMRLDSDEVLSPELQQSVRRVLEAPDPAVSGYRFACVQHMFGKPMRHGVGLRELNMRPCLFRRGTARHPCLSEHEAIATTGRLEDLSGHYDHYTNRTVEEVVGKYCYYVDKDLERIDPATLERPNVWRASYRAARAFGLYYVRWRGYRDGALGFFSSVFRGPVFVTIDEAKRWQAWERARGA
jgi:glycosyltransferase involved in cell wall biosynthesis